ncbi:FMN-binding glutamate synthase family protein [Cellvibrio japonicus]|nr:FMN-binding glutamate synthase family protein [Cellvibrio japonicus]QEI14164.1 FMN-binding glutamate synthase family protein [Cellvibrio japonicus]QEI16026.1 FMN-binding glutamate synthase family protein [Cellvibrio japonicus]QEI21316.1 FMN-binding glutamate synthase family protein [Cellvibrio japonicus]
MNNDHLALAILTWLEVIFIFAVGLLVLSLVYMYIADVTQTTQTIRKNYPIIGRFRYFFEHLGEFFRQYFFAQDREEMPFNRADRSWVYRAAKNVDSNVGFGSTLNLQQPGTLIFLNSAFPIQEEDALAPAPVTIGPFCTKPYTTQSIFNISAMSYGAISKPAVLALSRGAAKAGCWLNTGEGGLSPYHLEGGCDLVFQIGTAKYGVRDLQGNLNDERLFALGALEQIKMFEIKLSQGAKPGKGGILPAEKVSAEVAEIRGIHPGEASISPNGHRDIRSVQDLLNMVERIRHITGKPVGFKAVMGDKRWLVDLVDEIRQRGIESAPDFITLDSADGGTGAAPQPLIDHVGLPIKESLPWLVSLLRETGLKERIKLIVAGKLITPSMVAWALATGADFVNSARGFMFALGCIQALQCHKNTCPTGITTHNTKLQKGLNPADKAERVASYQHNMTKSVAMIAHSCGLAEPRMLRPEHVHLVMPDGFSVPLPEIQPQALIFRESDSQPNSTLHTS